MLVQVWQYLTYEDEESKISLIKGVVSLSLSLKKWVSRINRTENNKLMKLQTDNKTIKCKYQAHQKVAAILDVNVNVESVKTASISLYQ